MSPKYENYVITIYYLCSRAQECQRNGFPKKMFPFHLTLSYSLTFWNIIVCFPSWKDACIRWLWFLEKCYKRLEMESTEDIQIPLSVSGFCFREKENEFLVHLPNTWEQRRTVILLNWPMTRWMGKRRPTWSVTGTNSLTLAGTISFLKLLPTCQVHAHYPSSSN